MKLPAPEPGLVISYAYLWRYEYEGGRREGRKVRPCVIVLAVETIDGHELVTVAPITSQRPEDGQHGVELPPRIKAHLHLDADQGWVIIDEVNQFRWPGFDLAPVQGRRESFVYGFLPPRLYEKIKSAILALAHKRKVKSVSRDNL